MVDVQRVINDIVSPCSLFEEEGRALGAPLLISDCEITYENMSSIKDILLPRLAGKLYCKNINLLCINIRQTFANSR